MSNSLSAVWNDIASGRVRGTARDFAASAGLSEAHLLAAGIGNGVTRLDVDWSEALPRLEDLGEVRVGTRNRAIAHEKLGRFGKTNVVQTTGLVLNGDVDLRIFFGHWRHTFLVETRENGAARTAIRVFDLGGDAVHEIFRTAATDGAAWDAFVAAARSRDQTPYLDVLPPSSPPPPRADDDIDVAGLRSHWERLNDVHHFHDMLAMFEVGRLQAMRLVGEPWSRCVSVDALACVLRRAATEALPFMVFVGNPGCIQIHTGPVRNVVERGGLVEVDDPAFLLRAEMEQIASAWVVRKPSRDCVITTLELYDVRGENCAILCGQRNPGEMERPEWIAVLEDLPSIGGPGDGA